MRTVYLSAGLALSFLAGCGGSETDRVALAPCAGKVFLDGKPLEGAQITFVPDGSNPVKTDGGDVTGTGGTFRAKYRNRDGLAPGKYKVVVSQPVKAGPGGKLPDEIANDPGQLEAMNLGGAGAAGKKAAPPPWPYGDAGKSPLSHEITSKGDTDLVFDLKSTAK